jgi:fatty acid desaturase
MKKIIYLLSVVLLGACSSPKYTASFNSYDSPTGYREVKNVGEPAAINPTELIASTSTAPVEIRKEVAPVTEVRKTYIQMSKTERKALRTHMRNEIKTFTNTQKEKLSPKTTQATQGMDNDLKLAAVFGAVGIVALIIGGDVFWIIGGIAMLIGVVFFVKWLLRQ